MLSLILSSNKIQSQSNLKKKKEELKYLTKVALSRLLKLKYA